ncbi:MULTISPECIES: hypothetical protein [Streptomyces]
MPRVRSWFAPTRRADLPLLAVCGAFAGLSLAMVPPTLPLGWDEIVYASRFPPYAPATPFSAPRTRGVPLLISPVAAWSDSTVLLRLWLTLLSTAALYLGFRPWLRVAVVGRPAVVGVAAGLYGSLWFALFYANSAMPNHYTAMGATAAVGLFLGARPGRLAHAGIAVGLALAALMRPNDGAAVALPLLVAALLVPAWRTRGRVLAVVGGVLAGLLPWAIEAYLRFGGIRERLTAASEVQGGLRPLASIEAQFTALDGPLLCRPCAADHLGVAAAEWLILLSLLMAAGLCSARPTASTPDQTTRRQTTATPGQFTRRPTTATSGQVPRPPVPPTPHQVARRQTRDARGQVARRQTPGTPNQTPRRPTPPTPHQNPRHPLWLTLVVAGAVALPYFLLVPYGAPRFLLPAHALLAIPSALGLFTLTAARSKPTPVRTSARSTPTPVHTPARSKPTPVHTPARRHRLALTTALAVLLSAHLAVQFLLVLGNSRIQAGARGDWGRIAHVLHEHGVRAPCLLDGSTSVIPLAYVSGCSAAREGDRRRPDALVLREKRPPPWARDWRRHPVPDTYAPGWTVLVPPPAPVMRNPATDMRS